MPPGPREHVVPLSATRTGAVCWGLSGSGLIVVVIVCVGISCHEFSNFSVIICNHTYHLPRKAKLLLSHICASPKQRRSYTGCQITPAATPIGYYVVVLVVFVFKSVVVNVTEKARPCVADFGWPAENETRRVLGPEKQISLTRLMQLLLGYLENF